MTKEKLTVKQFLQTKPPSQFEDIDEDYNGGIETGTKYIVLDNIYYIHDPNCDCDYCLAHPKGKRVFIQGSWVALFDSQEYTRFTYWGIEIDPQLIIQLNLDWIKILNKAKSDFLAKYPN